ncbi:hypothetical protein HJFPF1_09457 [Paramyrothecium foliicola]|nr:hypothetical protein HJFPF1_09457 [Paramyrothecium foliicola]
MTAAQDLKEKIEAERIAHLVEELKRFNPETQVWSCPAVTPKAKPSERPCQRRPKPLAKLVELLLSLLEEQTSSTPSKHGIGENDFNGSNSKTWLLGQLVGLVACQDHERLIKARIEAEARTKHETGPSTPSRVRSNPTSVPSVSDGSSSLNKSLDDTQLPAASSTPVRPRMTRSQANKVLVKPDSPEHDSFDSASDYTATPQSIFSPSDSPYSTPFTPPSTATNRKHGYLVSDPQASPTQARSSNDRWANLRSRQKLPPSLPQNLDDGPESPPRMKEQGVGRKLFPDSATDTRLAKKLGAKDRLVGAVVAPRPSSSAQKEGPTDGDDDEGSNDSDNENLETKESDALMKSEANKSKATHENTPQRKKNGAAPGNKYPPIPPHLLSEKWAQPLTLVANVNASQTPTRHDVFKLIEKGMTGTDWKEGLIYIAVHRNYIPEDPSDPRRLFKVGLTENSIRGRYNSDCKVVGQGSLFVARSTKLFRGARRVEQLVHAELFEERRKFDCPYCKSSSPGKNKSGTTHKEWFLTTEAHVTEVVKRWKHFIEIGPYEDGKLKAEAKDFLVSVWESSGLVSGVEKALKAKHDENKEPRRHSSGSPTDDEQEQSTLFVYETPQLMADADAAVIVPTRLRYVPDGGVSSTSGSGAQRISEPNVKTRSRNGDQGPSSRFLMKYETREQTQALRVDQSSDSQLKRSEAARKRWDIALASWKPKAGVKAMAGKLRRTSEVPPEQVPTSTDAQIPYEPKVGLIRRTTERFLKSK